MDGKKPRILLCEDDPNLGSVLKNYLELNDYDVTRFLSRGNNTIAVKVVNQRGRTAGLAARESADGVKSSLSR